jgi:two-component system phosphate regulon sensor histidine kinase PhoR
MQQLVEDLISLSRIEAERFSLPRDSIDVLPLIEEVRTSCQHLIEERQGKIVVNSAAKGTHVLGDRSQLLQLIRNLIVNALKYGRPGTDTVVAIGEAGGEMLQLSVTDQGEGIPAEHLPRLTERFYRVDPGRSRAMGGTGLGLAIVKHIVGRHRGRLAIKSRVGEGTTVEVLLPRAAGPLSSKSHTSVTEDSLPSHIGPTQTP